MSGGFDSNPFADPEPANPFDASGATPAASTLEDYNPFADKTAASAPISKPAQSTAAEITPSHVPPVHHDPPPAYATSAAQRLDTSELQKRQEELEQKAKELQEKEDQLKQAGVNTAPGLNRADNWPPLPDCCGIKPCFYQDFSVDIAAEFRKTVRFMYILWIVYATTNILNLLLSIAYFSGGGSGGGSTFGLAILWMLCWPPLSFICWYRPVYKAFRSDSSINFFCFFFCFFIHIIICIVSSVGIPGSGYIGFITASSLVGDSSASALNRGVGAICFITAVLYVVITVCSIVMLIRIHRMYRYNTTASFSKAQAEFGTAVMKNEAVQQAGAQAASGAVQGAMAGQSGSRY